MCSIRYKNFIISNCDATKQVDAKYFRENVYGVRIMGNWVLGKGFFYPDGTKEKCT